MSMNKYMHPRNIYKQPPDFKQLAIDYPEFRQHVKQDITGKVSVNFKDLEALRALTCTLLKKDFAINMEIPLNRLIPTVPLRLNYILWIEDLLDVANLHNTISGIDIGTGASCIYPLIAAKKNKWKMLGTEIDDESIKIAKANIERNSLNDLIDVIKADCDSLIEHIFKDDLTNFDFCMCNPPFFSSTQELHPFFKAKNPDRPRPRNAFCASVEEVVSKGGEVDYINKLIVESKKIGSKIKIYTTMIGHKSSLPVLKQHLRDIQVVSFKHTEFCQGHTTRWGLAWTFLDIDLRKVSGNLLTAKHQSQQKPLILQISKTEDNLHVDRVRVKLEEIFTKLLIEIDSRTLITKKFIEFVLIAYSNTWIHQRRKRREEKHKTKEFDNVNEEIQQTCNQLSEIDFASEKSTIKRHHEDSEDQNGDEDSFYAAKKKRTNYRNFPIYLKFKVAIKQFELGEIFIEMTFIDGSGGKDAMCQIMQYIKNSFHQK